MFNNNTSRHESFGRSTKPAILMKGINTIGVVSISNNHFTPYFNNESFNTSKIEPSVVPFRIVSSVIEKIPINLVVSN